VAPHIDLLIHERLSSTEISMALPVIL